ncbi:hypothetical protein [Enorma massiliensis]|uniref:Uncharacterized protein n=1 Tax=Enorma massiliensis TaxID=1472761 RepID=A0A1Y3U4N1_9ACTN|nr:hypothetical protein [Enorma massiliensis]OUN43744.1 hypothetical protein B5G21_03400 [Enorma massiliensis]
MKEWIKDHALEMVAIVISLGGAKGLFDFWARLHEMFGTYLAEASFACALSAAVAAVVTAFFMRCSERRKLAAKDTEIAGLRERPTREKLEEKVRIEAVQREDAEKAFEEKRKECEGLRGKIAEFKKRDSDLATFRMKFKALGPEDMEWVVRVYRAGRQGLEPSDAELAHFNDGVAIKEFLRLDAATQRLFLVNGVEGVLDGCGDLVSCAMRVVCEQDVARAEARATAAEAKLAERDAEASMLAQDDRILHMDYLTKGLLYAIATGDEFKTRDDDSSYLSGNAKNLEAFQDLFQMGLANYETCSMHELRWFGTELAAKLVEEHSDLFGKAKEEVEEIRRKEGAA